MKIGLAAFLTIWLSFWSLGVGGLLSLVFHLWKTALAGGQLKSGAAKTQAIFMTGVSALFLAFEVLGIILLATSTSLSLVVALIVSALLHAVFHFLLRAPTRAGRAILDKIEGFKLFLTAVEGDRLSRVLPSEKTPEMFEKFLPYALALDVEQAWAEKFSGVLNGAHAGGQDAYSPSWYSGNAWNAMGPNGFVSSLSGSFAGAISSSSSAPGSSSGGGGSGGGSGGGGGGGGGGGW